MVQLAPQVRPVPMGQSVPREPPEQQELLAQSVQLAQQERLVCREPMGLQALLEQLVPREPQVRPVPMVR